MEFELDQKHVLVVGLGASGKAAAEFCRRRGARVTVTDRASATDLGPQAEPLEALGCRLELGGHHESTFGEAELIVLSPGVDHRLPIIRRAQRRAIPVVGEIELASRFIDVPIVAVTGTNGKTTTTGLIGEMLDRSGVETFVGGNIGRPLIEFLNQPQPANVIVVEVSSFQLDTIERFRPRIAVLLNISADHLDRYDGFDAYVSSKMRIFENQQPADTAIVNAGDPVIAERLGRIAGRRLVVMPQGLNPESSDTPGARVTDGNIVLTGLSRYQPSVGSQDMVIRRSDIGLTGEHNLENAAAAVLAALTAGATMAGIKTALAAFKGLAHRMEDVGRVNGIRYINDSKATNMGAVIRALQSIPASTVLILGGRNKGGDFGDLIPFLHGQVKGVVAMGECRSEVTEALAGRIHTVVASDMAAAVAAARDMAQTGDTVLFSPGCASFDKYGDYTERGRDFKQMVYALTTPTE